jgi:hypothetical protein
MAKRIAAKIDEYEKDGQTKGKYVDIGVILSNEHGEYVMLNPTVDLSGVLMKQRLLAQKNGKQSGGNVMCSIFDNDNQSGGQAAQSSARQSAPDDGFDDVPFIDPYKFNWRVF